MNIQVRRRPDDPKSAMRGSGIRSRWETPHPTPLGRFESESMLEFLRLYGEPGSVFVSDQTGKEMTKSIFSPTRLDELYRVLHNKKAAMGPSINTDIDRRSKHLLREFSILCETNPTLVADPYRALHNKDVLKAMTLDTNFAVSDMEEKAMTNLLTLGELTGDLSRLTDRFMRCKLRIEESTTTLPVDVQGEYVRCLAIRDGILDSIEPVLKYYALSDKKGAVTTITDLLPTKMKERIERLQNQCKYNVTSNAEAALLLIHAFKEKYEEITGRPLPHDIDVPRSVAATATVLQEISIELQ